MNELSAQPRGIEFIACAESAERYRSVIDSNVFSDAERNSVYGAFGRRYFPAVFGGRLDDRSFIVSIGGEPAVLAECSLIDGALDHFGHPVRLSPRPGLSPRSKTSALRSAIERLIAIGAAANATIHIGEEEGSGTVSDLGELCLGLRGSPKVRLSAVVDLAIDDDGLRQNLRKSYKSLVNWGRREMTLDYLNAENPSRAILARFQALHHSVAGKTTRSQESWDAMFQAISSRHGEAIVASLDEMGDVAACMAIDGSEIATYYSAAYDHARADHPLAHWPLFELIRRSRARGMKWFDLGEIVPAEGSTEREFNVGRFKKGMATHVSNTTVWRWSAPTAQARA